MRYPAFSLFLALALPATPLSLAQAAEVSAQTGPRQMVTVDPNGVYRVVYDIHSDEQAAGISKGLYYARGLFEAFRKQGVKPG